MKQEFLKTSVRSVDESCGIEKQGNASKTSVFAPFRPALVRGLTPSHFKGGPALKTCTSTLNEFIIELLT